MRTKSSAALLMAAALLLSGCTGGETPDATPTPTLSPEDVVASVPMTLGTAELEIGIHPLVRVDDVLVLTLEVAATDPDDVLQFGPAYALAGQWGTDYVDARAYDGARLVDTEGDTVAPIAVDAEGKSVSAVSPSGTAETDGDPEYLQLVYGDPGADELSVYLPKAGLVPGIPVIAGAVPEPETEKPLDLKAVSAAPVFPMVSYSYDTASETRQQQDQESTTITLASDVLFAFDSAELTPAAEQAITQAAGAIAEREPGPVQVTGHTDDVGTDAYNQDLSVRRAQSVAAVLSQLIDTEEYPLDVSGRGETEPIAENTSDDGRALNRRVALTISTPVAEAAEEPDTAALADIDGVTARGEDGVDAVDGTVPVHITAPRARMVDGHLVVTIEVLRTDDAVDSAIGLGNLGIGGIAMPQDFSTVKTAAGIAVMTGSVATLPVFHRTLEGGVSLPLADVRTNARIDGGQVRTFDLVYPRGIAVEDTVTVQLLKDRWRLTDIPVEEE